MADTPETPDEAAEAESTLAALPQGNQNGMASVPDSSPPSMTPQEVLRKLKAEHGSSFTFPNERCEKAFDLLMERYQEHRGLSYRELKQTPYNPEEVEQTILIRLGELLSRPWNGPKTDPRKSGGKAYHLMEWMTENLRTSWSRCWSMAGRGKRIFQVIDTGKPIPEELQQQLQRKDPAAIRKLLRIKCPDVLREVADVDSQLGYAFDCLLKASKKDELLSPQQLGKDLMKKFPDLKPSEEGDGKRCLAVNMAKGLLRKLCYIPDDEDDLRNEGLLHLLHFQIEQKEGAYKITPRY